MIAMDLDNPVQGTSMSSNVISAAQAGYTQAHHIGLLDISIAITPMVMK